MTNNPTIDGVSLLPCPFCGGKPNKQRASGDERDGYADRVAYVCSGCGCAKGAKGDTSKGGYADNSKIEAQAVAAWNSRIESPEVAAMQSTIAQLEEKLNKAIDLDFQRRETIARLEDLLWDMRRLPQKRCAAFIVQIINLLDRSSPAPPAPARPALPERKSEHYSEEDCDDEYPEYARGWNACLDATAALNGVRK